MMRAVRVADVVDAEEVGDQQAPGLPLLQVAQELCLDAVVYGVDILSGKRRFRQVKKRVRSKGED
jgi:hypothetical protein